MKKLVFGILMFLSLAYVNARSLHPCTPTERVSSLAMSCAKGGYSFAIGVKVLASRDIPMCQGDNRVVYKTANVYFRKRSGKIEDMKKISFYGDEFSYSDDSDDLWFRVGNTTLDDCAVPLHGGFSIGNIVADE